MLDTHEKFRMLDKGKKNHFFIEVNWEKDNKDINQCKVLKVTFPDNKVCYLDKKYLNELLFAIGSPSEQQKMIPQKISRVRHYETVVSVKAKRDLRKGEEITFPINLTLPAVDEEVIGNLKKTKGLYLPK